MIKQNQTASYFHDGGENVQRAPDLPINPSPLNNPLRPPSDRGHPHPSLPRRQLAPLQNPRAPAVRAQFDLRPVVADEHDERVAADVVMT